MGAGAPDGGKQSKNDSYIVVCEVKVGSVECVLPFKREDNLDDVEDNWEDEVRDGYPEEGS